MKKLQIVLASHNRGKIAEISSALANPNIEIIGLDSFPNIGEIEETGTTFEENALIKARAVADRTGLMSLADDSGLCVDALAGQPGVFSARYSDDMQSLPGETRDWRNIRKLLASMKNIPAEKRGAYFETSMAAVAPNGQALTATGRWHGEILAEPVGSNGFGYDPVFYDPVLKKSAAQLTRDEKTAVSHRGKALKNLLACFPDFLTKAGY